jgi:hypothetical protein
MRFPRFVICSAIVVAATACASSGATTAKTDVAGGKQSQTSSPDYVTSIEIEKTAADNAFELISRLRPRWLTSPGGATKLGGGATTSVVAVYLDGFRVGVKENLKSISSSGIVSMRWYDAARAATILHEVGSEPIAGAIVINTKHQ